VLVIKLLFIKHKQQAISHFPTNSPLHVGQFKTNKKKKIDVQILGIAKTQLTPILKTSTY
jgi:hypothetical protein